MDQPRNRHAPITMVHNHLDGCGLGRHGPSTCLGAPRRGDGHAFASHTRRSRCARLGAPARLKGRGAPDAVCSHSSAPC